MGNKRTLAIIGASVLILGFFLPLISVFGLITLSYFDLLTRVSARFSTGLVIVSLGLLSLALALKNNFRPLIGTGVLALAVLVFDFVTYKSFLRGMTPNGGGISSGAGSGPAQLDQMADQFIGVLVQPAFGMFLLAAGAILLIVAGAMKDKPAAPDWNNNPPPPMDYS
ncbi:MAG TPA: hypothetical protein VJT74_15245 [Pyrinomonadaceae bacterium]|nr:hypothetical protein [Pyrinomonadaceae bacterium]